MNSIKEKTGNMPVLDKGFVRLVEFSGGDLRVVQAARVSFGATLKDETRDKVLIEYLLQHSHFSPFEHSTFQFHIKCPIFVARQWMRHRWCSYNEISARYTEVKDEFYIPEKFRVQDTENRQGSLDAAPGKDRELIEKYSACINQCHGAYKELIAAGVSREMARMLLPVSQYTQFYWTVNARSLMNFISLRTDAHAQWEIQQYANAISEVFKNKMPWSWEAFAKIKIHE